MKVIAIDPGERVGWATFEVRPAAPEGGPAELVVVNHGISFLKDFALTFHKKAKDYDVMVYETWRLRAAMASKFAGNDFPTVQLIGMLKLSCWLNPSIKVVSQGPNVKSTADRTMPDDLRQRIAALPAAHDDSHDGDALRHGWHWFWTKYVN
jgi:uncharacterized protein YdeI (YjbR/CyaY-like superfamily)